MASITIRNLDDDVKTRLRVRAAEHSRSMEEEARIILREAVSDGETGPRDPAKFTRECFVPLGGVMSVLEPAAGCRAAATENPRFSSSSTAIRLRRATGPKGFLTYLSRVMELPLDMYARASKYQRILFSLI